MAETQCSAVGEGISHEGMDKRWRLTHRTV